MRMAIIDQQGRPTGRVITSNAGVRYGSNWLEKSVPCSSVMVRRCCFDTVGVFDQSLLNIDDWDMWIRIAACYRFAIKETFNALSTAP